jgi:hypothetical protein
MACFDDLRRFALRMISARYYEPQGNSRAFDRIRPFDH